jgi:hypothetical protein
MFGTFYSTPWPIMGVDYRKSRTRRRLSLAVRVRLLDIRDRVLLPLRGLTARLPLPKSPRLSISIRQDYIETRSLRYDSVFSGDSAQMPLRLVVSAMPKRAGVVLDHVMAIVTVTAMMTREKTHTHHLMIDSDPSARCLSQ